jgi:DNA-binding transcriptional MocR family regulator
LAEYLTGGSYDRHLRKLQQQFAAQIHRVRQAVLRYFPGPVRVSHPQGGFVLWIQLPKDVDSLDLYHRAMQKGISISPGTIFSATGQFRNYIRLNCANTWSPILERAIRTLGQLIEQVRR